MKAIAMAARAESVRSTVSASREYDANFTKKYEALYTKVFAFVYSRTRNVELSKDLVAEVFERAYVKGHSVRDQGAYSAWIFMIAKNLVTGHYRRQKREFNCENTLKDEVRFADSPPDPEEAVLRDERIGHLMRRVRQLPRRDQDLLSLKFDAELTYAEIADITGMTALNARVSIFRALKRLRSRMEAEGGRKSVA